MLQIDTAIQKIIHMLRLIFPQFYVTSSTEKHSLEPNLCKKLEYLKSLFFF